VIKVSATIVCDHCRRHISVEGGPGTNASEVRNIASQQYGWVIGSGRQGRDLCFDDRVKKIEFHPWTEPDKNTDQFVFKCAVCGVYDPNSRLAQHREETVLKNAAQLRERMFANWS